MTEHSPWPSDSVTVIPSTSVSSSPASPSPTSSGDSSLDVLALPSASPGSLSPSPDGMESVLPLLPSPSPVDALGITSEATHEVAYYEEVLGQLDAMITGQALMLVAMIVLMFTTMRR